MRWQPRKPALLEQRPLTSYTLPRGGRPQRTASATLRAPWLFSGFRCRLYHKATGWQAKWDIKAWYLVFLAKPYFCRYLRRVTQAFPDKQPIQFTTGGGGESLDLFPASALHGGPLSLAGGGGYPVDCRAKR